LWILGRSEEALAEYAFLRRHLGRVFYGDARQYVILRDEGRDEEAQQHLEEALREVNRNDVWLRQILQCLAGELDPVELVAAGTKDSNAEHTCEAYYYAGEAYRLAGDLDNARVCFQGCVDTELIFEPDETPQPMNEYELAGWRLRHLATNPSTSQPGSP
jgi:lipoprotein NlpI